MKVFQLFWSLLSVFLTYSFRLYSLEVADVQNVTVQERDILEEFFKRLITKHHFGYVLFGNKPMATCGIAKHIDVLYLFSDDALINQRMQRGWNVWQKQYQSLKSDNFILRLTKNPVCPSMDMLVLINRELVLKCIEKNITLFHKTLGEEINPDQILFDLETKDSILQNALKNHEELFGILLGYGTHNSLMYVKTKPFNKYFSLFSKITLPLELSSDSLPVCLTPFSSYDRHLMFIDLPQFAIDECNRETINLKNSYYKTLCELNNHFQKRSFFNTVLTKWIGGDTVKYLY